MMESERCSAVMEVNAETRGLEDEKPLPDAIVCEIMLRVGKDCGHQTLLLCMEVCKQWRDAAQSAVYAVTWTCGPSPLSAALSASRYENLRAITMDHCMVPSRCWPPVFEALGRGCPRLTSLDMLHVWPLLDTADLFSLFSNNPSTLSTRFTHSLARTFIFQPLMASLQHLHISSDNEQHYFENIRVMKTLSLPTLHPLTNLSTLSLQRFSSPLHVPPLSPLPNLRSLSLFCCSNLPTPIPALSSLTSLQSLDLDGCSNLCSLPPLDALHALHTLLLNGCYSLVTAPGLEHLTQLRHLDLTGCHRLQIPSRISALRRLEKLGLDISRKRATWALTWLPRLADLLYVSLRVDKRLRIPSIRLPSAVHHVDIQWMSEAQSLNEVEHLVVEGPVGLRSLSIQNGITPPPEAFGSVRNMWWDASPRALGVAPAFAAFERLCELSLQLGEAYDGLGTEAVTSLPRTLTSLSFQGDNVETLPRFHTLTNLQKLEVSTCRLREWPVDSLARLDQLRELALEYFDFLETLPDLGGLLALRVLKIQNCLAVRTLPPLGCRGPQGALLRNLEDINLLGLQKLRQLPALDGLTALKRFTLNRCRDIARLPPFCTSLAALEDVSLAGCTRVEELPPLTGLTRLQALDLRGCSGLTSLPSLNGLSRLLWLDLGECTKLRVLEEPPAWEGAHEARVVFLADEPASGRRFYEPVEADDMLEPYARWRAWTVDATQKATTDFA